LFYKGFISRLFLRSSDIYIGNKGMVFILFQEQTMTILAVKWTAYLQTVYHNNNIL